MSQQEPSGNAYRELAARLADVIEGVGRQAERVLTEAESEAARVRREARAEAARVSSEAQEEADRVLTRLADRRDAMMRQIRLLDDQLMRVTSELEGMIRALGPEDDDEVAPSNSAEGPEEAGLPFVIPESELPESADDAAATASPEASEPTRSGAPESNGESSLYDALWGPYEGVNLKPEDSASR